MNKISALIFALTSAAAFGQSVETTGFDPDTVAPDDVASYTVIFKGVSADISPSAVPLPEGLQIIGQSRSQNFSFVNGKSSSSTSITYSVRADREGKFTIPEWKIADGSKTYAVKAATLTVDKNAQPRQTQDPNDIFSMSPFGNMSAYSRQAAAQQQQQIQRAQRQMQSFESSLKNNASLEIKLPSEKIYVGQSVPCELVFSYDKTLAEKGFNLAQLVPSTKKADAFDCPAFDQKPTIDTTSNPARILIRYRTAITPLKAGNYDLDFSASGVFNCEASNEDRLNMSIVQQMMSFGGARQIPFEINMPAKKISVSELPAEGKPEKFTGAIGSFSLENVTVEPDALSVGEPCTITAKIIGIGNFPRVSEPWIDCGKSWKTYKAKTSFTDESNGLSNIGIKTFEYTVVPKASDLENAPELVFNFFNPELGKYVEVRSKKVPVSVAPSGKIRREEPKEHASAPELDKIMENSSGSSGSGMFSSPYFWAAQTAILAALAAAVILRRKSLRLLNDKDYAKRLACLKAARKHLKAASANSRNIKKFLSEGKACLQNALSADTDCAPDALLWRQARAVLIEKGISEPSADEFAVFFEGADAIAFGGMDVSKIDAPDLAEKLKKTCAQISKIS